MNPNPPTAGPAARKGAPIRGLAVFILIVAAVVIAVAIQRVNAAREVERATEAMAIPAVTVIHPEPGESEVTLTLPGNVMPFTDAPIYARTSGYLRKWYFDIGSKVKEGDLLAEIDTPEVDQQLNQALAAREQAKANVALARTTADRWLGLLRRNAVSQQDADEKTGNLAAQEAALSAADAEVRRLQEMQSFKRITAPFGGTLTARKTDIGDLISSGNAGSTQELFRIAQTGTLRVYVSVPEIYSGEIRLGDAAAVDMASAPGRPVTGRIVGTAGAIDPASRTLLVEIQVPNADNALLPGSYARVDLKIRLAHPPLVVPINTILFRPSGPQVGVVGPDDVTVLKDVRIGRNFGTTVEIDDGLSAGDRVVLNPVDSLTAGTKVSVRPSPPR
jgi:RND family efflux transporter MFP subunit